MLKSCYGSRLLVEKKNEGGNRDFSSTFGKGKGSMYRNSGKPLLGGARSPFMDKTNSKSFM